jgi:EmrB/QacA subfamily drug resistance transporter
MNGTERDRPAGGRRGFKYGPMMAAVFLGSFMVILSSSTINIALPFLMERFGSKLDTTKWALTGFMLAMGSSAPLTAFLGERLSYKKLYLISIVGFAAASTLAAFSGTVPELIAMRCLQGLFGGVTVPASMAMIYQVVPKERQVAAITLWSLAPTLGPALGPTLGGFLIQFCSWRAIFLINLPLGLATVLLAVRYMPYFETDSRGAFDLRGLAYAVAASVFLLVPCSQGAIWGWTSMKTILLFAAGAATLAAFVRRELAASSPVLDLRVFKYPRYCISIAITCVINIALYAGSIMTPIFLQSVQHLTALESGIVLLPASLAMVVFMLLTGKLYDRVGPIALAAFGLALMSLGLWRMSGLAVGTSRDYIRVWKAVVYAGLAFASMPAAYAGMSILPKRLSGHGSSINNWLKQVTGSLSIGVFSSLLATRASFHRDQAIALGRADSSNAAQARYFVQGLDDVYAIACVIALVGVPLALSLIFAKNERRDLAVPLEAKSIDA